MPADYASEYTPVLLAGLLGFLIVGALLFANSLLAPRRREVLKGVTYECGILPTGGGWAQYHVRYYLYAILFLIFEVEAVFIFPWAVVLDTVGERGFLEMLVFLAILAFGLAYAWRKGVLEWEK
jgi:NADH:ubiquinone oxidoreductase subunit 3 (subunit A)